MTRKRKAKLKILFTVFLDLIFWAGLISLVVFLPPKNWAIVSLFFLLFFFSLFLVFALIAGDFWFGGLLAFFLTAVLALQLFKQLHWLNILLLFSFCLALFLHRRNA